VSQVTSVRETETHDSVLGVDERSECSEAMISIVIAYHSNMTHLAVDPE
jgi:hypothetical protein